MKNLNKGKIDPMTNVKRLEPKKTSLKKIEIKDSVEIGEYLIEAGDTIFVEMEDSADENVQYADYSMNESEEDFFLEGGGAYAAASELRSMSFKIQALKKEGKTPEEIYNIIIK